MSVPCCPRKGATEAVAKLRSRFASELRARVRRSEGLCEQAATDLTPLEPNRKPEKSIATASTRARSPTRSPLVQSSCLRNLQIGQRDCRCGTRPARDPKHGRLLDLDDRASAPDWTCTLARSAMTAPQLAAASAPSSSRVLARWLAVANARPRYSRLGGVATRCREARFPRATGKPQADARCSPDHECRSVRRGGGLRRSDVAGGPLLTRRATASLAAPHALARCSHATIRPSAGLVSALV
jgi:hypothetical protein